ncbi:MAG TPA: ROK family protein [Geobacteraceae bacterium]|nr:ROK family protein [Geobacteraceae bacterium]
MPCVMSPFKIGIDLGGTKTEAVLLDPAGSVLYRKRTATPSAEGYAPVLAATHELILETASRVPRGKDFSIGVGIPGSIDKDSQLVRNANSTCLIGRPLQKDLEDLLGRKIGMMNDANCFTLAESRLGAAQGYSLVFGVIMGTGCGGGIAMNGEVREGPNRIAGEWGHFPVDPQGAPCYCGNRGCVETKISGSGVEAAFFAAYGRRLSMKAIVRGYREGDTACGKVFGQFLDDFGRCLGGLISILDPDAVVLGGGLSNIEELYLEGVEHVRRYAFHEKIHTPILKNALGDSAGVFGAAWIGM